MRARMALRYSDIQLELREVALSHKPPELLAISPKATVPVLVLPGATVLDESLDIMRWALTHSDPQNWLQVEQASAMDSLINENDETFKLHLDHYKYAERFPEHTALHYRQQAEVFLTVLESRLQNNSCLFGSTTSIADIALLPFIRQFAHVDIRWFDSAPYPHLRHWLNHWLNSDLFLSIMQKHPRWEVHQPPVIF